MERVVAKGSWTISDALWAQIVLLLPPAVPKPEGGRLRMPDRRAMEAIFYVRGIGCQWKALPRAMDAASTVHDRFQEWVRAGVFERMGKSGLMAYDQAQGINWSWLAMDGAMTKALLGGASRGRIRRAGERAGDARGVPVGLALAGANHNDFKLLQETVHNMPVTPPRADPANADDRPNLCLGKGCDYREVREQVESFG